MLRETQFLWTRQFPLRIKSTGNELLLKDWGQEILDSKEGGKMRDTWSPLQSSSFYIISTNRRACVLSRFRNVSLGPYGLYRSRLLCPWDSPGKNTGVGCHALLQGVFPTQGLNLHLLHCRQILYCWATREALQQTYIDTNMRKAWFLLL